jgi:hypothetical protein
LAIQEVFIREPGSFPVSGVLGPCLDRDVFGNLEAKDEVLGRGIEELRPILLARELVERQVTANRRKDLRVFFEAALLKLRFRQFASGDATILAVNAPEPTVIPRRRTEIDSAIGQ